MTTSDNKPVIGSLQKTMLSLSERALQTREVGMLEEAYVQKIIEDPEIIEPGLTFKARSMHVTDGETRGFIDILCRSGTRDWVILEVKRSREAARDAAGEILKYHPLLCKDYRLPLSAVRCIVVSSVWAGLRLQLSELKRICGFDLRGVDLELDDDGNIIRKAAIDLSLEPPSGLSFGKKYAVADYRSATDCENIMSSARAFLSEAGVRNWLATRFDYDGEEDRPYPHRLCVAVEEHDDDSDEELAKRLDEILGPEESDSYFPSAWDRLIDGLLFRGENIDCEHRAGSPGAIANLVMEWNLATFESGPGLSNVISLWDAMDIENKLSGLDIGNGQNVLTILDGLNRQRVNEVSRNLRDMFESMPEWVALARILRSESTTRPKISLRAFNPRFLNEGLLSALLKGVGNYLPSAELFMSGQDYCRYVAALEWDGVVLGRDRAAQILNLLGRASMFGGRRAEERREIFGHLGITPVLYRERLAEGGSPLERFEAGGSLWRQVDGYGLDIRDLRQSCPDFLQALRENPPWHQFSL